MKGLSIVITVLLLFVAHLMAARMKQAGILPAETHRGASHSMVQSVDSTPQPQN